MRSSGKIVLAAVIGLLVSMPAPAFGGWGVDSGRATEQDVFDLRDDWMQLKKSLQTLERASQETLSTSRQMQLLGIDDKTGKYSLEELVERAEKWWKQNIDSILMQIAKNPAASCAEARQMLALVAGVNRQKQLLGLDSEEIVGTALWNAVAQRCHEEVLDECNLTGRFEQIILWAQGESRQGQLFGFPTDDGWAIDALKECGHYELRYVSEGDIDDDFKLHTVIEGRVPIKVVSDDNPPVSILAFFTGDAKVEGETNSNVNPFLKSVDCGGEGVTIVCSPGGDVKRPAWAQIMNLKTKYREYEISKDFAVAQTVKGENKLEIKFLPAMLSLSAVITTEAGKFPMPFIEAGGTAFYIAHKNIRVEDGKVLMNAIKTGVYPVMFEFEIAASGEDDDVPASDRSRFELIHKPKKKPFPPRQSKPRVPLKPNG